MARRNPALDAVIEELETAEVDYTVHQRKHVHITWLQGNAKQRIIVSKTASDHRAILNARCEVRRKLGVMHR